MHLHSIHLMNMVEFFKFRRILQNISPLTLVFHFSLSLLSHSHPLSLSLSSVSGFTPFSLLYFSPGFASFFTMSTPNDETPDLFCYEYLGCSRSRAKARSQPTRYKPQRGSGNMKPVRRASIITRRKIRGAKITEYISSDEEEKPKPVVSQPKVDVEPPRASDLVEIAVKEDTLVTGGAPDVVVEVGDARSETGETTPVDLVAGEVVQPSKFPEAKGGSTAGPSSGVKRIRTGLSDGLEPNNVWMAYLQIYYPQYYIPPN